MPARSGAKLREYHFVKALGERHVLTYLHFTDPGSEPLTRKDLPFCEEVLSVPKPGVYGPAKMLRGAVGKWPLPILNYMSEEMSATVAREIPKGYDLIHLDSIHMIRYAPSEGNVVYDWHNIESEAMRRFSETVSSAAKGWYARQTAAKLAKLESEILKTALGHIVCSAREQDELKRIEPSARVGVVENGVDVAAYSSGTEVVPGPSKIVFVGLMDYYPNVEAVTSFAQQVWPAVRRRFPKLSLWIIGANPAPAVRDLGKLEGVTVTGTVPDVRPYYRDALAAIVPLRTGGGTRLKILEAMAAGVPVISTPLGAEGLSVTPSKDILIADPGDAAAWTRQLACLIESEETRKAICASALELVRSQYDWGILGRKLCGLYEGWLASKA